MNIQKSFPAKDFSPVTRTVLLLIAIVAALGPNGLYIYSSIQDPELNQKALANPVALAFMMEAMVLLAIFLWFVFQRTRSVIQVIVYLVLTFVGSLAFSFPFFLYVESSRKST